MTFIGRALPFLSLALLASLPACGSGGGGGETGELTLALTDAASDEVDQFEVDVTDVMLTRLDGSTVSVLTRRARVDFAQLTELSELITRHSVPIGTYSGLLMTLDFATAAIMLKGQTVAASVVDAGGTPLTGSTVVRVNFASNLRPNIAVRRNRVFVLDLDLDQSITPDLGNNRVAFSPAITATVDATIPKPVGVTGILSSVDLSRRTFTLDKRDLSGNTLVTVTVTVDNATLYQVNGVGAQGTPGLTALASLTMGTDRVFAQGVVNRNNGSLAALAVEAGAGTFGNGQDWVEGHIAARNNGAGQDATLTVRGRGHDVSSGTRTYDTSFAVNVFLGATKVLRRGATTALNSDSLQVGQRVLCFGVLSGTTLDCSTATGVVRCLKTSVFGIAAGAPSNNVLTLDVVRFDLRDETQFNFNVASVLEADVNAFTVDVTGLGTAGVVTGSRIRVQGFMNPVGNAGDQAFTAEALTNRQTAARLMTVIWPYSAGSTITSATSSALVLEVSGATIKRIDDGFAPLLLTDSPAPQITPPGNLGIFRLVRGGVVEVHTLLSSFLSSLDEERDGGAHVVGVMALGTFSAGSQTMIATIVTVFLQ
jgi:hypothetical protein